MAIFKKKEDKKIATRSAPSTLPDLPELPELPPMSSPNQNLTLGTREALPQLPSFPTNALGEKISQNTIKEAVSGRKEETEVDADDLAFADGMQMMQKPLKKPLTSELDLPALDDVPKEFHRAARIVKEAEPVFVRLDKFEDSLKTFEKIRLKVSEVERTLNDINKIKAEEEKALEHWTKELVTIKTQIDRIDKDIFSQID